MTFPERLSELIKEKRINKNQFRKGMQKRAVQSIYRLVGANKKSRRLILLDCIFAPR